MKEFDIESLEATPNHPMFNNEEFLEKPAARRKEIFMDAVSKAISKYMYSYKGDTAKETDLVKGYAKQIVSLGLLYMEYCDGIREEDGERIIRCWRFMLLIFKVTDKRKYSIQAATLLLQHEFLFTERLREQLLWSRTINTRGKPGKNIPMDLHLEHLNRVVKDGMRTLSSNVNKTHAIERIGKSLKMLVNFLENFDKSSEVPSLHDHHSSRSSLKDLEQLVEELQKADVFTAKQRQHSQFPKCNESVFCSIDYSDVELWLKKQLKKMAQ